MRLFFALTFDELTKKKLTRYQKVLQENNLTGRKTRTANFHITLVFIGESSPVQKIALSDILHQLTGKCDSVLLDHFGSFHLKGGQLVWVGIAENPALVSLQAELSSKLVEHGYMSESRAYVPHITLARQVSGNPNLGHIKIEPIQVRVRSIALMNSQLVDSQLVYEVVDERLC